MKQQFYEPQVGDSEQMQLRGFPVQIGGTYVLLDDVVTALRMYADTYGEPAVGDAASWLQSGDQLPVQPQAEPETVERQEVPVAAPDTAVDRVEVYPDMPGDPKTRWIARSCDPDGRILEVTNGSLDQEYVIQDAQNRWPGAPVHLVEDYMHDTVWEENDPGGIRSSHTKRRRPSPNRMYR